MYILEIEMPNLAKGTEVQIDGLGVFANGESHVIEEDAVEHFLNARAALVTEFTAEGVDVLSLIHI